jgi:L-seryl-tRNA(Ser) seleniumtransferase
MRQPRVVINGKAPATVLGAAHVPQVVIDAMVEAMRTSVHMGELQASAGTEIAAAVGAQAAFVTGCSAAGMAIGVAAAIGGHDLGQVATLPQPLHERTEVVIQKAHMIIVGGCDANQVIRLGGGRPVEVGTAADCADFHLRVGLSDRTAAGLFIDGERAHGPGTLSLRDFARLCHDAEVPVIVDAAGTKDPRRFFAEGADLVVFSIHKSFRGPTAGVLAGSRDLVDAAFLHAEFGVGRPMKAGKESVAGALAAVRLWAAGGSTPRVDVEDQLVNEIVDGLAGTAGLEVRAVPTPHESTSQTSVHIDVDARTAGIQAWQLAQATEALDPSVVLYDYEAASGYLLVDPGLLQQGDSHVIVKAVRDIVLSAQEKPHDLGEPPPPRLKTLTDTVAGWLG